MPDDDKILETLLTLGLKANKKQYHTLLTKVSAGGVLTAAEQRQFDLLDADLRGKSDSPPGDPASQAASKDPGTADSFSNVLAVTAHLQASGYKVKKSTVYNHVNARRLERSADGTFSRSAVDRYALAVDLPRIDGTPVTKQDNELQRLQREKMELDNRRERAETELAELKLEARKKDLITGPLEKELAARLIIFKSDIETFIRSRAAAIVACVNGDLARTPELVAFFLAASETWLARYSQNREFRIDEDGRVSPSLEDDLEDNANNKRIEI